MCKSDTGVGTESTDDRVSLPFFKILACVHFRNARKGNETCHGTLQLVCLAHGRGYDCFNLIESSTAAPERGGKAEFQSSD